MLIRVHGNANRCDLEDSYMQHMHRGGPENFSQNSHPIDGKAPACEDLFIRMSVRSKSRSKKTDNPNNLDTSRASLPVEGGVVRSQQLMKEEEVEKPQGGHPQEERNKSTCRITFKV